MLNFILSSQSHNIQWYTSQSYQWVQCCDDQIWSSFGILLWVPFTFFVMKYKHWFWSFNSFSMFLDLCLAYNTVCFSIVQTMHHILFYSRELFAFQDFIYVSHSFSFFFFITQELRCKFSKIKVDSMFYVSKVLTRDVKSKKVIWTLIQHEQLMRVVDLFFFFSQESVVIQNWMWCNLRIDLTKSKNQVVCSCDALIVQAITPKGSGLF